MPEYRVPDFVQSECAGTDAVILGEQEVRRDAIRFSDYMTPREQIRDRPGTSGDIRVPTRAMGVA